MAYPETIDLQPQQALSGRTRTVIARRLADIVCLPSSRIGPQERWIVGDLLHEILKYSDTTLRRRVAVRLAEIADAVGCETANAVSYQQVAMFFEAHAALSYVELN